MGKQINELPFSPFTTGINIASQIATGGEGSTVSIKSDDILSLIGSSTDLRFAGTWDQASLPPSPEDGQFWIISSTGEITIGGINYYPNDWLVYINSTIGWKKNTVNVQFLQSQIDEKLDKNNNLSDLQSIETAKTNLSLNNVDNTSDLNKPISTATQAALDNKLSKIANLSDLSNIQTAKANLLLNNVDNTSDLNKPISTATQTALDTKLNKSSNLSDLQSITIAKTNLSLNNVDNTSDLNKPISTATQTALNNLSLSVNDKLSKSANLSDLENIQTAKTNLNLNNVDNTSDLNKPISTATQSALDTKLSKTSNLSDLQSIPQAKSNLSINNVDNTSDLNKPISNATQAALTSLSNEITQVSGADNYRGDHDLSSGSYPSATPSKGDYWVINVAGTVSGGNLNGVSFNVADWILYLGSTKQWIKVLNSVQSFSQVNSDWNSTSGVSQILNKPQDTSLNITNTLVKRDSTGSFETTNINLNTLKISSQTTGVLDQDTIGGALVNSASSFWQSITCGDTGFLNKVVIYANFSNGGIPGLSHILNIRAGLNNTGSILYTITKDFIIPESPGEFILPQIPIQIGDQYSFQVIPPALLGGSINFTSSSSNVYPNGNSSLPNKDIRIQTYVASNLLVVNDSVGVVADSLKVLEESNFLKRAYFSTEKVLLITSNNQALTFDFEYYKIENTANGIYTLPDPSTGVNGLSLSIKLMSDFPITINAFGSETIDGDFSITINQKYTCIKFILDNTNNWLII